MGAGSDVAIESSGVTLLKGDLQSIVKARCFSCVVMTNIRQNLIFDFISNAARLPVAAGALCPAFDLLLSPQIVAGTMALSLVSVITIVLGLRSAKL